MGAKEGGGEKDRGGDEQRKRLQIFQECKLCNTLFYRCPHPWKAKWAQRIVPERKEALIVHLGPLSTLHKPSGGKTFCLISVSLLFATTQRMWLGEV